MFKIFKNRSDKTATSKDSLKQRRPPWTAKSVWVASGLFIAAAAAMALDPEKSSNISWFQSNATAIMTMAVSFIGGFLIAWWARRAIIIIAIVTGIMLAAAALLVAFGGNGSEIKAWIDSTNVWVKEYVDSTKDYLTSLLPSATAAGMGGFLGFRRK